MGEADVWFQFVVFAAAIAFGAGTAILYDFIRIKRRLIRTGRLLSGFEDLLFWIFIAFSGFIVFLQINGAALRPYIYVGFIVGAIGYSGTISKYVITFFVFLIYSIIKVYRAVFLFFLNVLKKLKNLGNKGVSNTKINLHS